MKEFEKNLSEEIRTKGFIFINYGDPFHGINSFSVIIENDQDFIFDNEKDLTDAKINFLNLIENITRETINYVATIEEHKKTNDEYENNSLER